MEEIRDADIGMDIRSVSSMRWFKMFKQTFALVQKFPPSEKIDRNKEWAEQNVSAILRRDSDVYPVGS
jgi:hypothetical protein